jgi:hypothetical protein
MRKFKDLNLTEKLLLLSAILLIVGIIFKWPQVKEGFVKSLERFGIIETENIKE